MRLDAQAWEALQDERPEVTSGSCSGPSCEHFATMARAADDLAAEQERAVAAATAGFDDERDDREEGAHRRGDRGRPW